MGGLKFTSDLSSQAVGTATRDHAFFSEWQHQRGSFVARRPLNSTLPDLELVQPATTQLLRPRTAVPASWSTAFVTRSSRVSGLSPGVGRRRGGNVGAVNGREPNGATLALLRRYERSKGYRYQGRGHYRSGRSVLLSVQKERGGLRAIFGSLWVGG